MKLKRLIAAVAAMSMAAVYAVAPVSAEGDYGTVTTGSDGSVTLSFGADSITTSGGGEIKEDVVNGISLKRPDNLRTDVNGTTVLTLPDVNIAGYGKVDLCVASKNAASATIKVGDTEIASFDNISNNSWEAYQVLTSDLLTSEASGNVTINIKYNAKTYCGNYAYVKFYGGEKPIVTADPDATAAPAPSQNTEGLLPYQDESLSFEERAADLVSRMTLEEKVTQLGYTAPAIPRLGVSNYNYWKECLHGVARQGKATNFPASLALSNTWNKELVQQVADITSTETRAKNNRYNLSYYTPTINMARDPRWGRNEETYGEDPYLTGQLGGAFVKGMQGDDEKYVKIIATIKHFAANNNEAYRRGGSSVMDEFTFRNYYLKPFKNVTEIEMPGSVMSSYNATTIYRNAEMLYNYLPSAANTYLLTDILRRTWGFDGYVTTDCGAGNDLIGNTSYMNGVLGNTTSESGAYIAAALKAGMDLECNLSGGNSSVENGVDAVLQGYISEEQLETNIYRLFLQRFRTGEFDSTSAYRDITSAELEKDAHVAAAEEAAEESWVLLKNDNNTLPLNNIKNVAVVGNMANTLALGDYTGSPEKTVNPISGMRAELGAKGIEVNYLGEVTDDEKLFNVKSITLVMKDGKTRSIDLSKAENVAGMTLVNGSFTDVTPKATAVIKNVDFLNVASIQAEISTGSRIGGSLNITYGQGGPGVAAISSKTTADIDTYEVCSGEYTGEDGGYNGKADMYISASAAIEDFTVANYKTQLDAADVIIAYAGTVPKQEGFGDSDSAESKDRKDINLPAHQAHVQPICDAYPDKTVVVMSTVGQINVEPFMNKCKAILWTSYNGQTQGTALGKVLTGEVNPSGKLSTTWYKNADVNKMELANTSQQTIGKIAGRYTDYNIQADGTNPGHTYQYYSGTPVYPFGYGLSYTSFEYSNMTIDKTSANANDKVKLTVDVKNTGSREGMEVVQLYVAHPQDGNKNTPKKQLKGFEKIQLAAGETKTVGFELDVRDMALYSESAVKNVVPSGTYTAYIAKNASDTSSSKTFDVSGTLDASLTTVKAMPTGISLNAYISEDRTQLKPVTTIDSQLSATMYDESIYNLSKADVTYTSSNENVASVNDKGIVTSGFYEGVATITASVTVDGVTKTDSFPVVNKLQVANDDIPYVIEKITNKDSGAVDVTLSYRGSVEAAEVTLKAEVLNVDGTVKSKVETKIKGAGKYEISTGAEDSESVKYTVVDNSGTYRSDSITAVYNTPIPSKIVAYYLENPDYDYTVLTGGANSTPYAETVNGLSGYGAWNNAGSKAEYTYVDVNENEYNYSFTKSWSAGAGSTTNRSLYFTPEGPCKVTAVFQGSEPARSMTIKQGSRQVMQEGTGTVAAFSLEVTDTTEPVYVYGGSSNKNLYAIIVEYYGMGSNDEPMPKPTIDPSTETTDMYKVAAGSYSAGDTVYDNSFSLRFTNNVTAAENTTSDFTHGVVFRTQLGGDIKGNVSDAIAHFADAGLNGETEITSLVFTPKHDGTAKIYLTGVSGERTMNVWDNTTNSNDPVLVSNAVFPAEFKVKANHAYIIYGRKWTSTFLGLSLTYANDGEESTEQPTTKPTEEVTEQPTTKPTEQPTTKPTEDTTESPSSGTCVKIVASYENGVLKNVEINKEFPVADITDIDNSGDTKTFFWKSLESMEPIQLADKADEAAENRDIEIQSIDWNGTSVSLTSNPYTGETKVWQTLIGDQRIELSTDIFADTNGVDYKYGDKFTINSLAAYKDRVYAGCDGGYVIVFTTCPKCYKLMQVCEFDIKELEIADNIMTASNGEKSKQINMTDIGGDSITAEEAEVLIEQGAVLVDLRDEVDAGDSAAVNVQLADLEAFLADYDADTTIIFGCYSGIRAGEAVKKAKQLGYTNVYNLGSIR